MATLRQTTFKNITATMIYSTVRTLSKKILRE